MKTIKGLTQLPRFVRIVDSLDEKNLTNFLLRGPLINFYSKARRFFLLTKNSLGAKMDHNNYASPYKLRIRPLEKINKINPACLPKSEVLKTPVKP